MKTSRFSGLLCVLLAMFALPASAQTPDGTTPANEGICDPLADATPGLQGLCIAMCEAQDCEAELDTNTGEVVYDPSCSPSSDELFGNYNNIAGPSDPPMPCVKVACPCWTEIELDTIADRPGASCTLGTNSAKISGASADNGGREYAYTLDDSKWGLICTSMEQTPFTYRWRSLDAVGSSACQESVRDETISRGMTCY